ncbi:MAG: TIGR03790 family protein [Verrucomicrobiota bacterium]
MLVVYNSNDPDSKSLADYYAQKRDIPAERVLAISCPITEEISRRDYEDTIRSPIVTYLSVKDWIVREPQRVRVGERVLDLLVATRNDIWAIVLIRGVPLKIANDADDYFGMEAKPELQTNAAAVDSELTLLPVFGLPLGGFVPNIFFDEQPHGLKQIGPELARNIILVTRLDGPTPDDVRRMIDDSLEARAPPAGWPRRGRRARPHRSAQRLHRGAMSGCAARARRAGEGRLDGALRRQPGPDLAGRPAQPGRDLPRLVFGGALRPVLHAAGPLRARRHRVPSAFLQRRLRAQRDRPLGRPAHRPRRRRDHGHGLRALPRAHAARGYLHAAAAGRRLFRRGRLGLRARPVLDAHRRRRPALPPVRQAARRRAGEARATPTRRTTTGSCCSRSSSISPRARSPTRPRR